MSAEREGKPMMSLGDCAETLREVARELDHRVDLGMYAKKLVVDDAMVERAVTAFHGLTEFAVMDADDKGLRRKWMRAALESAINHKTPNATLPDVESGR
jgi:hypothetical protein